MQLKHKLKILINALAFGITLNATFLNIAFAGNFFVGASVNIQKDEYKLQKKPYLNKEIYKQIEDLQKQIEINNNRIEQNTASLKDPELCPEFQSQKDTAWLEIKDRIDSFETKMAEEHGTEFTKIQNIIETDIFEQLGIQVLNKFEEQYYELNQESDEKSIRNIDYVLAVMHLEVVINSEDFKNYNEYLKNNTTSEIEPMTENDLNVIKNFIKKANSFVADDLTPMLHNFNTLYSTKLQPYLAKQNKDLNNKLQVLFDSKEYKAEQELNSIQTSASGFTPSVSLLGGYAFNLGNFGFITEIGVDFNNSNIVPNHDKKIELNNKYNLYLTQKLGYSFLDNTLTYITFGVSKKDYHAKYDGDYIKINHKESLNNLILGFGSEFKTMNNRLGVFFEINNIIALNKIKTEIAEIKPNSYQARVGFRYYFGVNQNKYSNNVAKNSPFSNTKNNVESVSYSSLDNNNIDTKTRTRLNNVRFKINNF